MQVKCDKCGAVAETLMSEIEYTFFRYPVCPITATNDALQKRNNRRRQMIRIKPVTEQFLRDTEALKQENLKRNQELIKLHPLALFPETHADVPERLEREEE